MDQKFLYFKLVFGSNSCSTPLKLSYDKNFEECFKDYDVKNSDVLEMWLEENNQRSFFFLYIYILSEILIILQVLTGMNAIYGQTNPQSNWS